MSGGGDLQFERAEFEAPPASMSCAECSRALTHNYWEVQGRTLCERCQMTLRYDMEHGAGTSAGRFFRAAAFGLAAAIAGTLLWYGVRRLTGYELGLIAIVVGWAVGGGVRLGSRGRGGWRYQALAMLLTYTSIVANYVPDIVEGLQQADTGSQAAPAPPDASGAAAPAAAPPGVGPEQDEGGPAGPAALVLALAALLVLAFIAPFLGGFENIMGLIIIGIALYEAWKLNRRMELAISGPFQVGTGPAPGAAVP